MENNKNKVHDYIFYSPESEKDIAERLNNILNKITHIQKEYPELFINLINETGVCKNYNDLEVFYNSLLKEIKFYNKKFTKKLDINLLKEDDWFLKDKKPQEQSLEDFVSKQINDSIKQSKNLAEDVFRDCPKNKIMSLAYHITIQVERSNMDWLEDISKSTKTPKSKIIRKCFELYKNKI